MALIWQRQKSLSTDFLGDVDECYTFRGDAHKKLARKYLGDLQNQHKQFLFFYGEQGIGKSRLAKQTARELARLVNSDSPLLSLFMINCERYGKDPGPTISNLKRDIAQKVAAVDEKLSKTLSQCEDHNFSSTLSAFLKDKVFLFLFDGIIANFKSVASLMDDLVKNNSNVVVFATSSQYLVLTRQKVKISTHSCIGLSHDAALALLQEVAGDELEYKLRDYQDDLVQLCHYNPFLIMRTGQQMNDDIFPYTPREMKDLLKKSVMLATSCENVPEGEDIFKNELNLINRFTREMGKNVECVITIEDQQFTVEDVANSVKRRSNSDGTTKKSLLESLSHSGVLTHDQGFYSLSQIFKEFCEEQKVLLNLSRDDVVIEVYKELKNTLDSFMSKTGVHKLLMIHGDEMKQIQDLEKKIPENEPMRFVCRGHLIEACCSFLLNIPLDSDAVSNFRDKSFAHLLKVRVKEHLPSSSAAKETVGALAQEFMQLDVEDFKVSNGLRKDRKEMSDKEAVTRRHGGNGHPGGIEGRRNQGKHQRADNSKGQYHQKPVERRGQWKGERGHYQPADHHQENPRLFPTTFELPNEYGEERLNPGGTLGNTRRVEYSEYQRTSKACSSLGNGKIEQGEDSVFDRFSLERPSPFSHFSDFTSLKSSVDSGCDEKSLDTQRGGVEDMATRLDFCAMYPEPPPQSRYSPLKSETGNIPVEDSFHDPSSPRWAPSAPSQQSFHEWPNDSPLGEDWSLENNPPSLSHRRQIPPE